jgi:hypothetical protein
MSESGHDTTLIVTERGLSAAHPTMYNAFSRAKFRLAIPPYLVP